MLRTLIFMSILLTTNTALSLDDNSFAQQLQLEAANMFLEKAEQEHQFCTSCKGQALKIEDKANLYVFISTSMPEALIKNYLQAAKKYNGVLVLNGLPNNSFKELIKFVGNIVDDLESSHAIQIDDEAFARFGITQVPSIVLAKETAAPLKEESKVIFDKMVGNVGIEYALEQFAGRGDLAAYAKVMHAS